ncbi:hypothetical protein [Motilimonas pumila]|uniref:Uncharacterized protein n=1 Tax=Motilimonas pumila TaxID=2303987 RepID=A0A418YA66_9GAMM|nr:hypothetical protein [Motilimonas pumila]RJG38990.1 hypothetical protein D1Z90_18630 [Motilimonas pumila]
MKDKVALAIFTFVIGFGVGGQAVRYIIEDSMNDSIQRNHEFRAFEAQSHLVVAKAVRDNRLDEAIAFSESIMDRNISFFLKQEIKDSSIDSLIRQAKDYKVKDCSNKCLPSLNN